MAAIGVDFERQLRLEQRVAQQPTAGQEQAPGGGDATGGDERAGGGLNLVTPAPRAHPHPPAREEGATPLESERALQAMADELSGQREEEQEARDAWEAARVAADTSHALRRDPPPQVGARGGPAGRVGAPPHANASEPIPCRYSNTTCEGCGLQIKWGELMVPAGRAMAHATGECRAVAEQQLAQAIADGARGGGAAGVRANDSLKRATLLAHRLSDARVERVRKCLEGQCEEAGEARTFCVRGCGRGVHMTSCCALSTGRAALGLVICCHCRVQEMLGIGCSPPAAVMARAAKSMLVEMTTGADSTAHGFASFVRLEKEWQASVAGEGMRAEDVNMPHTNAEAFYEFVVWLATDRERAHSLGTTVRSAGAYMTKLGYRDFTKEGRVKALVKELETSTGVVATPRRRPTRK